MTTERCTNVVIGSGEAGKFIAWHLARQGQRTIIVERSKLAPSGMKDTTSSRKAAADASAN